MTICPQCFRPYPTDEDWDTIPEGEGTHLCWSMGGPCYSEPAYTIEELLAVRAALVKAVEHANSPKEWLDDARKALEVGK